MKSHGKNRSRIHFLKGLKRHLRHGSGVNESSLTPAGSGVRGGGVITQSETDTHAHPVSRMITGYDSYR